MATPDDARRALLTRLIDHAPLFPPASLSLPEAIAEDERARVAPHAWTLARFVCPASMLCELPDPGRGFSAVLDEPIPPGVEVQAVEARYRDDLASLRGLAAEVYVEVPLDDELDERLDALAAQGLRAKVRCGGASVPDPSALAEFVRGCGDRGLPFKATAGLHHAVRTSGEHGFLNLLAAVVFGDEEAALAEADPSSFALDEGAFRWRGRAAGASALSRARAEELVSIGSCSFFEPVEELESLGVLPA
jgi:predicted transcriptional regulator